MSRQVLPHSRAWSPQAPHQKGTHSCPQGGLQFFLCPGPGISKFSHKTHVHATTFGHRRLHLREGASCARDLLVAVIQNWGKCDTYQTRDMPVSWSRRCLIVSGSDKQRMRVPRRWALAASCSPPRKTIYSSFNLDEVKYAVHI